MLIDGSVLANAPFRPAIAALEKRPARREVDRRFVYIDPKPGMKSVRLDRRRRGRAAGLLRHHLRRALRHSARAADPRQSRGDRADVGADPAPAADHRGDAARGRGGDRARGRLELLPRPSPTADAARRLARQGAQPRRRARPAMPMPPTASSSSPTVVEEIADTIFRLGGGGDSAPAQGGAPGGLARMSAALGLADADAVTAARRARRRDRLPGRFRPHLPHPPAALRRPPAHRDRRRRWRRRASEPEEVLRVLHATDRPLPRPRARAGRRGGAPRLRRGRARIRRRRSTRSPRCSTSTPLDDETDERLSEALAALCPRRTGAR